MRTFIRGLTLIVAFLALHGCMLYTSFKATRPVTQTVAHRSDASLHVESKNGSVKIVHEPGVAEVQVNAEITCGGDTQQEADARLVAAKVVAARDNAGLLTIKPDFGATSHDGDGADFVIKLPPIKEGEAGGEAEFKIRTSNGEVEIAGHRGVLDVETSNAEVKVHDQVGFASIGTSNADVTVDSIDGKLVIRTSNAAIDVTKLNGPAKARSSNGRVRLDMADACNEPFLAESSNGEIIINVGPSFLGFVDLQTSNGRVVVNDPAPRLNVKKLNQSFGKIRIGLGDSQSTVNTSNADITVNIR